MKRSFSTPPGAGEWMLTGAGEFNAWMPNDCTWKATNQHIQDEAPRSSLYDAVYVVDGDEYWAGRVLINLWMNRKEGWDRNRGWFWIQQPSWLPPSMDMSFTQRVGGGSGCGRNLPRQQYSSWKDNGEAQEVENGLRRP